MFPPIPTWDGLHPLVVHFPIALLRVAPLFMLAGLVLPKRGRPFAIAALVLILLGTLGLFVTASTGHAAGELAERNPQISKVLERHEELGQLARNLFAILAPVYAALVLVPLPKLLAWVRVAAQIVFLIVFLGGALLLANAAHEGGRLVHEFGVRAMMSSIDSPGPATPAVGRKADRD